MTFCYSDRGGLLRFADGVELHALDRVEEGVHVLDGEAVVDGRDEGRRAVDGARRGVQGRRDERGRRADDVRALAPRLVEAVALVAGCHFVLISCLWVNG